MSLYCWLLSVLSWLRRWPQPYISGHDYMNIDVDDYGRGTLECCRCGHRSTAT